MITLTEWASKLTAQEQESALWWMRDHGLVSDTVTQLVPEVPQLDGTVIPCKSDATVALARLTAMHPAHLRNVLNFKVK